MRPLRKAIFWAHLATGLAAGLVVLVMSVTGVLLTYERQITRWADGYEVKPPSWDRPSLEKLLEVAPQGATAISLERDPTAPAALLFGREKTIFLDPYTGVSLGEGNTGVRKFFRSMLMWHRWLGREGASQPTGRAVIGAGNLLFLFLVVSGTFLWFPKRWTRVGLRAVTLFQSRLKGRARDWNWHNVLGFWAALPLLAIVASGVVMSYPWANALVFQLAGEPVPPPRGKGKPPSKESIKTTGLDAALAAVQSANPAWQTIQIQLPPGKIADFTVMDSHRGRPDKRRQLSVDRATAAIVKTEGFSEQSAGRRARTWLRWIHTGEAGGLAGQTIAGLVSAASVVLVWTGLSLSWRRFCRRRRTA